MSENQRQRQPIDGSYGWIVKFGLINGVWEPRPSPTRGRSRGQLDILAAFGWRDRLRFAFWHPIRGTKFRQLADAIARRWAWFVASRKPLDRSTPKERKRHVRDQLAAAFEANGITGDQAPAV